MAIAPLKKADLVEISHPGFRQVYFRGEDAQGKPVVVPYTMAEIDAAEAVGKFPGAYSYEMPEDHGELQPPTGSHDPFATVPVAPSPHSSQAVGGADTSVGRGIPASPSADANAAALAAAQRAADLKQIEEDAAEAQHAADQAQADLEAAKGKGDKPAVAKAQAAFDDAKQKADAARAKVDAAKA